MEHLGRSIDAYCERIDASFWSEPLNAVTNLAFIVAAVAALVLWRRRGGGDPATMALIVVVFAVGAGSFAFHTVATVGASLADIIPIAIFIYGYFWMAMRRYLGLGPVAGVAATLAFVAASMAISRGLGGVLGSSAGYAPALIAMLGLGVFLLARRHPAGPGLIAAGAVFTLSLAARMADAPACAMLPVGTHFLWHILNAVVLYILLATAIRVAGRRASQAVSAGAAEKPR